MRFMPLEDAVDLIRMEFAELPGLKMTFWQVTQLWNLSSDLGERALATLIGRGFLVQTPDGAYIKRA